MGPKRRQGRICGHNAEAAREMPAASAPWRRSKPRGFGRRSKPGGFGRRGGLPVMPDFAMRLQDPRRRAAWPAHSLDGAQLLFTGPLAARYRRGLRALGLDPERAGGSPLRVALVDRPAQLRTLAEACRSAGLPPPPP